MRVKIWLCECTKSGILFFVKRKKNPSFLVDCRNPGNLDFIWSECVLGVTGATEGYRTLCCIPGSVRLNIQRSEFAPHSIRITLLRFW